MRDSNISAGVDARILADTRWTDLPDSILSRMLQGSRVRHVPARGTINLEHYLGPPGLLELLADIEKGDFPVKVGLELIRRLHVPGYEQSRRS